MSYILCMEKVIVLLLNFFLICVFKYLMSAFNVAYYSLSVSDLM